MVSFRAFSSYGSRASDLVQERGNLAADEQLGARN